MCSVLKGNTKRFIMRLFALLSSLSLVLADDDYVITRMEMSDVCKGDYKAVIYEKDDNPNRNSTNLPYIYGLTWTNITCLIKKSILSCFWSTQTLPKDVNYAASVQLCGEEPSPNLPSINLNCVSHSTETRAECQGSITQAYAMVVQVNISSPDYWYIICMLYTQHDIETLDPPQNITTSVKSTNLEIQWMQPETLNVFERHCFLYELKINNEVVDVNGAIAYNKINFDPTKAYIIQIRAQLRQNCGSGTYWSDWSETVVVGASEKANQLNVSVIASIAFVVPMILLAFLLVCKFQRVSERLFPSIPSPSKNIKIILEKEDFYQVPTKHVYVSEGEEGTEICQVTS